MDNYVYISVKLNLSEGQTHDSIQEIIQEMNYSFSTLRFWTTKLLIFLTRKYRKIVRHNFLNN